MDAETTIRTYCIDCSICYFIVIPVDRLSALEASPMRAALFLTALVALQATSALAQPPAPACDGDITIVRVSEIKPGAMQLFMTAVAAHKAWYRANGVNDNEIVSPRVLNRDEKTGAMTDSDKEVVSFHIRPPADSRIPKRGDAAWNAYVKQYRDSSDIKSEYVICMPKVSK
jgi:hypothetical protein